MGPKAVLCFIRGLVFFEEMTLICCFEIIHVTVDQAHGFVHQLAALFQDLIGDQVLVPPGYEVVQYFPAGPTRIAAELAIVHEMIPAVSLSQIGRC